MNKVVLASKNKHKLEEIKKISSDLPIEWVLLNNLDQEIPEIIEDGTSFEENAFKKAMVVHKFTGLPVVADDSGLEVDALNGAPGIYSARYGGEHANYQKNNEKLLKELLNIPDEKRTARFHCVAVYVDQYRKKAFHGIVEGKIASAPRGEGGFGYDPLFIPEGYDQTFAELGEEVKNAISHRARAFKQLKEFMKKILQSDG